MSMIQTGIECPNIIMFHKSEKNTKFRGWIEYNVSCGLYYKPMTILNDDTKAINKLEASLTDDARVVIYDCHMFIVQATEYP
jgi:hypothetical protein